ncbi:hypothetical protein [Escherichia phage vB_Eco_ZCEC08]
MVSEQRDVLVLEWVRITSKEDNIESAWRALKNRSQLVQFATRRCFIWRLRNDVDSR